ncbi:MAG: ATP-binding cassette domain-containing protein [Verrucomicrobia bacterium]|nr:ATP-binding cassette domain-containing protein [Verrucomicrobiota bacterium]
MITVEDLVKDFGPKRAVNRVSFTVQRGEILGFLGPNGAGKSTTMRMITGFIPPTHGKVVVGGHDVNEAPIEAKRLIGYLPESAPCYSDMTVHGFLSFAAEMRGLHGSAREEAVRRVVGMCFLENVLHQSVDTLSKGYRHRTCLAQSIIHDPQVLVLDEPTDGLDPNQKHEIRQLLKRFGRDKAIIFSTHILEEVDAVCSRAIIIDRGQVVANGTPAELRARHELAGSVTLRVQAAAAETVRGRLSSLGTAGKVTVSTDSGTVLARIFPRDKTVNGDLARSVAELAGKEGWRFDELRTEEGRLDDVFRAITQPDTRRQGA